MPGLTNTTIFFAFSNLENREECPSVLLPPYPKAILLPKYSFLLIAYLYRIFTTSVQPPSLSDSYSSFRFSTVAVTFVQFLALSEL